MYKDFFGTTIAAAKGSNNWLGRPIANTTVTGTAKNDQMADIAGGNTLLGGLGDDTYLIADSKSVIRETAGQGIDTVIAYNNFRLSLNIEVLKIQANLVTGIAADTGSLLVSLGSRNVLVSGTGNDVLADESKDMQNIFAFDIASGKDVVYNFTTIGTNHDLIKLADGAFSTFDSVKSALTQVGGDTLLTLSASDQVLLKGVTASDLTADHFLLSFSPANLKLTFADEFDGISLYNPNTGQGTWKTAFTHGPADGWGSGNTRTLIDNGEKQIYVDPNYAGDPAKSKAALGLNPFDVENGVLSITASKLSAADSAKLFGYQYASGLLTTEKTFAQTYGYFEIRAELPMEKGMFPAFWLLPTSRTWPPEIDIFESIGTDFISGGSIAPDDKDAFRTFFPDGLSGFHTYGLRWDADKITWYIDGKAVGSVPTPDSMHQDMYLLVNLAVGGNWAGDPAADFTSEEMRIDYVRAYSLDEVPSGPIETAVPTTLTPSQADLTLTGSAAIDGNGNALANALIGNAAANTLRGHAGDDSLRGMGGNDRLEGGLGNDLLDGGTGADTMIGGKGDDIYHVDTWEDVVVDAANEGYDTVISSWTYWLGAHTEALVLTGTRASTGGGNDLANRMTGNAGANMLDGKAGDDWLSGGDGNDTLYGGMGKDILIGGNGNDRLEGQWGDDTLTGGAGIDNFVFDWSFGNDVITDFGAGGRDTIDLSTWLKAGVKPTVTQTEDGAVIELFGVNSITLLGVDAGDLLQTSTGFVYH